MMTRSTCTLRWMLCFVAASFGSACSGSNASANSDADASTGVAPQVTCMTKIVGASCSTEGCHGATGQVSANLVLTHDTITDRSHFVDKPAQGGDGNTECPQAGFKLINSAMPEQSLIYQKLSKDACGEQMPETNPKLTDPEKACVLDWIKYLIAQNGKVGG